jgi:hypothetical protein
MLNILQKWGKASFNPRPNDILHFDVIFPLLNVLRQLQCPVRLVKVKSHTGCLMNEKAYEHAGLGYSATGGLFRPSEVWVPLAESPAEARSCLGCPVSEAAPEGQRFQIGVS